MTVFILFITILGTKAKAAARRVRDFGLTRFLCLLAVMIFSDLILKGAYAGARFSLWEVVNACVADHDMTGAPYPCLMVATGEGRPRGVTIVRPPIGKPDTLLVPTQPVVGIEDPWLRDPKSPNYFQAAWEARGNVAAASDPRVSFAINSRLARSQDQFHIHIGCLSTRMRAELQQAGDTFAPGDWRPLSRSLDFARVWTLAIPDADFKRVNPIRLLWEGVPEASDDGDLGRFSLVIVQARAFSPTNGFIFLAWRTNPRLIGDQLGAEDFLSPKCSR